MTVDPVVIALRALIWMLADDRRAARLLALTGLDADALRASAGEPATLIAALDFLAGYEPDLIACAAALDLAPADLIAVRARLA